MSSSPSTSNDYAAQSDAETLQKAEEIKGDSGRHQAALAHIAQKTQAGASTLANHARRGMVRKVKKHMQKVFGGSSNNTFGGNTPGSNPGGSSGMGGGEA